MPEESKEEFLLRHRRSIGKEEEELQEPEEEPSEFIERLKKWLFIILLLAFVWGVYQIFGMMKSN